MAASTSSVDGVGRIFESGKLRAMAAASSLLKSSEGRFAVSGMEITVTSVIALIYSMFLALTKSKQV